MGSGTRSPWVWIQLCYFTESLYLPELMLLSCKMGRIKHLLRGLASLLP